MAVTDMTSSFLEPAKRTCTEDLAMIGSILSGRPRLLPVATAMTLSRSSAWEVTVAASSRAMEGPIALRYIHPALLHLSHAEMAQTPIRHWVLTLHRPTASRPPQ